MERISKRYSKAIAIGCALLIAGTSMAFIPSDSNLVVEASDYNYAKGLQYSMYLYDANMCGTQVGENSAMDWRDDCHTADSSVTSPNGTTVDVSGGYHDAGDHVKFGLPQAYSASVLGWGYYEFKDAYTQTGQSDHMKTISTYFADYFKKCTVMENGKVTAFCYQVGDGNADHDEWCSPESQNTSRPTYWATSSNPATDIVSNTVGALAFHYKNFGDAESLTYAKALYDFAKSNNKQVATQGVGGFYDSDSYIDDLMWAAASLYVATGDSSYLSDASNFLTENGNPYVFCSDWPLCWGNMWPAVNLIFGKSGGVSGPYGDLKSDMMSQVSKTLDSFKGKTTLDGVYVCFDDWGSARYNTAMQLVGLIYDKYNNSSTYTTWAKSQMDYLLGDNSKNLCYITGFSNNSVTNPHHRAASGLSTFPTENATITMGNTLIGALVGGPKKDGTFLDQISNYTYTEVALDYNAGFVGAMAGLYLKYGAGQSVDSSIEGVNNYKPTPEVTTTPTPTTTTNDDTSNSSSSTSDFINTDITSTGSTNISYTTDYVSNPDGSSVLVIYVNTDDSSTIDLNLSGLSGYTTSGQVGYWNGSTSTWVDGYDTWENQTFDSNGNLTIKDIKVPTNTENVQIMLTYYADWSTGSEISGDKSQIKVNSVTSNSSSSDSTITSVPSYTSSNIDTTTNVQSSGNNIANRTEIENNPDGTDVLKIYANTTSSDTVTVIITGGTPGATTSGEVGYWDNSTQQWVGKVDTWEEQKFDSNGNLTITGIKVPANTNDVQIMLTYYADWSSGSENNLDKSGLNVSVYDGNGIANTEPSNSSTTIGTVTTTQYVDYTTTTPPVTTVTTVTTTTQSGSTLLGDINVDGSVKSNDLLLLKKYLLGLDDLSTQGYANADLNQDGSVKSNDLLQLKKVLLGLE